MKNTWLIEINKLLERRFSRKVKRRITRAERNNFYLKHSRDIDKLTAEYSREIDRMIERYIDEDISI